MGIRIEYWEIPSDDITVAILNNFDRFKTWYTELVKSYPNDADYDILEFFDTCSNASNILSTARARLTDEVIALYLGDYCDYGPGNLETVENSSMLAIKNYEIDSKKVYAKCSEQVYRLWDFILSGRAYHGNAEFSIKDNVFRFCFFSENECQVLLNELAYKFDALTAERYNRLPAIGSLIQAIRSKKGKGLLITVA